MKIFDDFWLDPDRPFWRGGSHLEKEICEYFFQLGQITPPPTIMDKMLVGIEIDRIHAEKMELDRIVKCVKKMEQARSKK